MAGRIELPRWAESRAYGSCACGLGGEMVLTHPLCARRLRAGPARGALTTQATLCARILMQSDRTDAVG